MGPAPCNGRKKMGPRVQAERAKKKAKIPLGDQTISKGQKTGC